MVDKKENLPDKERLHSQDIRIEFGIEYCAMLIIKKGWRETMERIELPNQESIRILEEKKNIWKVVFKQTEMKEKVRSKYLRKTRKLLETRLCSRNIFKGINPWAAPLVKYSGLFLE